MPQTNKGWYQWLPWASALGLALVFIGFMRADLVLHQQSWQERLRWQTSAQKDYLANVSRDMTQQAMLLAQLVVRDARVVAQIRAAQRAFLAEQSQASTPNTRAARVALRESLLDYWVGMSELGVPQMSVYVAPGAVNFLRMHIPDRYGDSVAGVRPLVNMAFSSGVPVWGADIARLGSGHRALIPITANDDQTGGVVAVLEVGMASLPQLDPDQAPPMQMASFLRKSSVEQVLWEHTRQALHKTNPTTVEDWRLELSSDPRLHNWWSEGLISLHSEGQLLEVDNKVFLTSWLPVTQMEIPAAESSLAMLVWSDITDEYRRYQSTLQRVIAKWVTALVGALLLLLVFIHFNRRYLNDVIATHRTQLQEEHSQSEQARQRLALALRSSDSGFWEWDIVKDRANFSPEWRQLCGLGPESAASLDLDEWMSRVHPADKRASYSDIIRHIKGETPMYENEYRLKVQDGSYKWILTRGKVVEWQADGKAALVVGVYTDITERKNTELISIRQQAALHSLNEIASLPAVDTDAQLHRALILGARYLGLSGGIISAIKGDSYRIRVQYLAQGQRDQSPPSHSLSEHYCSLTLRAQDVVAEDDIPTSEYRQHPAYQATQIESYIGAPLWIDGEVYGTLAFSSRKTRHHQYDSLDKDFVRLLARWISSVVERWQKDMEKKVILERFQKLSERLPGFLYQYQMRPDGSSFFPYASAGIKNIYDVEPEQVRDSAALVFALIHPEDVGWVGETVSYSAAHLTPWVATVRVNHPQRGLIWTHIESIPERLDDGSVMWNGYVSDISSLKQTELQLKDTNALRQAILDAANIGIISTDPQGLIKTFNHGAELMLGYTAAEMIDKQTPALVHLEQEIIAYAQQLSRELGYAVQPGFDTFVAKAREGEVDEREWIYVRKDGSQFPVLLSVSALRDSEGEITGYLGIARDITEIKRIDQMKTEFISTVSHELRTPLTAISGALSIIVNGLAGQLSAPTLRMIQIAHNNSQRLIYLVNDLLDMEKLVAGKMHFESKAQQLRAIILRAMEENTTFAQQYSVHYELSSGSSDVEVVVDEQRLLQVLSNYLSNATKFSPPNEVVKIELSQGFGRVRVTVIDKGPGIADDFRARLFQKFSQADSSDTRQKGGTGLGLAICKEIIERMGGKVGVESSPGAGASFYFELPCADTTQKAPATRVEPQKNKPHLLIVEDDAETAEVLATALAAQEYDVDCAATGQSALELLQLRDYDLITLDLELPDMNGIAIVEQIRQQESYQGRGEKKLPIIIITGALDEGKKRLSSLVARESIFWLQKPLVNGELESVITRALAKLAEDTAGAER